MWLQGGPGVALEVGFLMMLMLALSVSGQSDCQGKVGSTSYSLASLSGRDMSADDTRRQRYSYKVCGSIANQACFTPTDQKPAICQTDANNPPGYHDCGSQTTAVMSALPSPYTEEQGFTLTFTGGQDGRSSKVNFIW